MCSKLFFAKQKIRVRLSFYTLSIKLKSFAETKAKSAKISRVQAPNYNIFGLTDILKRNT